MNKKAPNETDKHVGTRIRMRRLMLGLSQRELGERVGIVFQQVHKYETGLNRAAPSRLQQFADVLNVSPSFFFEVLLPGEESSRNIQSSSLDEFFKTEQGLALAKAFMSLKSAALRQSIAALVEDLSSAKENKISSIWRAHTRGALTPPKTSDRISPRAVSPMTQLAR